MADLKQIVNEFNSLKLPAQKGVLPTGARVEIRSRWVSFDSVDPQFHEGSGMSGYTEVYASSYQDPRLSEEEIARIEISIDPEGIMSMRLRS